MQAIQPLVEHMTLQNDAVLSLLETQNEAEIPVHLKMLMSFRETDRKGRYDERLDIWVFPTTEENVRSISVTPCYPTYGSPEAEEG